jgi:hypothetical protein
VYVSSLVLVWFVFFSPSFGDKGKHYCNERPHLNTTNQGFLFGCD